MDVVGVLILFKVPNAVKINEKELIVIRWQINLAKVVLQSKVVGMCPTKPLNIRCLSVLMRLIHS
jgi:hypothetical protein